MKRLLAFVLAAVIAVAAIMPVAAAEITPVAISEEIFLPISAPLQTVPLRFLAEGLGGDVEWDDGHIYVTVSGDDLLFIVGEDYAYLNGQIVALSAPVVLNAESRAVLTEEDATLLLGYTGDLPITILSTVLNALNHMHSFGVPGMSVAIVDANTSFIWAQGLGFANTQTGARMEANTVVGLGSIAKTFTGIAIMQLVEQGLLCLDTPIVEYLPEFSVLPSLHPGVDANYQYITTRMLMNHTSGIPENLFGYASVTTNGHNTQHMVDFLANMATYHMISEPGQVYSYNNNATIILGLLVAAITGDDNLFYDFVAYTDQYVFTAMGLTRTSFITTPYLRQHSMQRYSMLGRQEDYLYLNVLPAGSAVSTAADMALYMHHLLNLGSRGQQIISEASLDQMLTPGPHGHGLIFVTSSFNGMDLFGHSGGVPDFVTANMLLSRDAGVGVFMASNSGSAGLPVMLASETAFALAVAELAGELEIAPPVTPVLPVPGETIHTIEPVQTPEPISLTVEELEYYTGVFLQGPAFFHVDVIGDMLFIVIPQLGEDIMIPMQPLSDGSFATIQGEMWFISMDGYMVLASGALRIPFAVRADDTSIFVSDEDFINWIGIFESVFPAYETSMMAGAVGMGICERGVPFEFHPSGVFIFVTELYWQTSQARNIERDENGIVLSFDYFGIRYERV